MTKRLRVAENRKLGPLLADFRIDVICEKLGVARMSVYQMIDGTSIPIDARAPKLAELLGISEARVLKILADDRASRLKETSAEKKQKPEAAP